MRPFIVVLMSALCLGCASGVARADDQCLSEDVCACHEPKAATDQAIYLGDYHGFVGITAPAHSTSPSIPEKTRSIRLVCPETGNCVCTFPKNLQVEKPLSESEFKLGFSGFGLIGDVDATVRLGVDKDAKLAVSQNFLPQDQMTVQDASVTLSGKALRRFCMRWDLSYGVEKWGWQIANAPKCTNAIVGITNLLSLSLDHGYGCALFIVSGDDHVELFNVHAPVEIRADSPHTIDFNNLPYQHWPRGGVPCSVSDP